MILFGYRVWSKVLATLSLVCGRCGNPAAHHVVKRQRWFTLFFIPVIPLHITRYTQCTYCGAEAKIGKADADRLVEGATHGTAQQPGFSQPGPPQQSYPQQPPTS